jgi:7,8-dihydropterin-6-yl-methyl-4-(beta-D-ribofuranosyl)aminobenzene 5'-phosphate synthase
MKITTLIENNTNYSRPELNAEHGVSFYIEYHGHTMMSDVSQSEKFAENASRLGIDLKLVEALAISHHHYDHGGGLPRFFKENDRAKVYLRESPDVDYILEKDDGSVRYIGLDRDLLKTHSDRIVYIGKNTEVFPGFHLLTDILEDFPKPAGDRWLKAQCGDRIMMDTFKHEIVTVLENERGLVILTGCGHNGVLNMIAAARRALPDKPILAVVGGFHMLKEEKSTVRKVGEELLAMEIPAIYTGHCTGKDAVIVLEDVLGNRLHRLCSGLVMEF